MKPYNMGVEYAGDMGRFICIQNEEMWTLRSAKHCHAVYSMLHSYSNRKSKTDS